jgi:NADH pyrophosphatase NudC (nudix superfamily)
MRYLSGHTDNHDHEVDEARWFEIKAAKKALKYVNEKRLVDLGLEYLEREGDSVFAFEPETQPEFELEAMRDSSAS